MYKVVDYFFQVDIDENVPIYVLIILGIIYF